MANENPQLVQQAMAESTISLKGTELPFTTAARTLLAVKASARRHVSTGLTQAEQAAPVKLKELVDEANNQDESCFSAYLSQSQDIVHRVFGHMEAFCGNLDRAIAAGGVLDVGSLAKEFNAVQLEERREADDLFNELYGELSEKSKRGLRELVEKNRDGLASSWTDWEAFAARAPDAALGLMRGTCFGLKEQIVKRPNRR